MYEYRVRLYEAQTFLKLVQAIDTEFPLNII